MSRPVCPLCVAWRCEACKSTAWPHCCDHTTDAEPYWPDGTGATLTQNVYCTTCQQAIADMEADRAHQS